MSVDEIPDLISRAQKYAAAAFAWLEHMRDIGIAVDPDLSSEAEQLRRIWGASLGTARRNEKARQQRLKDERAKRRRPKQSQPPRYPDPA